MTTIKGGDDRFHNNVFVGNGETPTAAQKGNLQELRWISSHGLWGYDGRELPLQTGGNVYYHGAQPYAKEANPLVLSNHNPAIRLVEEGGQVVLHLTLGKSLPQAATTFVTTELLGRAKIPGLPYVNPDDSPLRINTDYLSKRRSQTRPTPGPFEKLGEGDLRRRVW